MKQTHACFRCETCGWWTRRYRGPGRLGPKCPYCKRKTWPAVRKKPS